MLKQVAKDLREASVDSQEQTVILGQIAKAFEQAAEWEGTLHVARQMLELRSKAGMVTEVARSLRAALHDLTNAAADDGRMVVFPGGWVGHQGSAVPANLVMLIITRDETKAAALSVTICNTGQGAFQYHPSEYSLPPAVDLRPCAHLPRIEAAALQDAAMCWMLTLLRAHDTFYVASSPAMYFYECVVTELLQGAKGLREAFDHGQPAWCSSRTKGYFNTGQKDKETINECLLMLLRRFGFQNDLAANIFQKLRLNALQQLEEGIHQALHGQPRACIVDSDVALIQLATRVALSQTIQAFPEDRPEDVAEMQTSNVRVQAAVFERIKSIRAKATEMQRRCRLAPPPHVLPELRRIDSAAVFHPFPSCRLALDESPFSEARRKAASVVMGKVLNLHQAHFAKREPIAGIAGFMKAIELTLQVRTPRPTSRLLLRPRRLLATSPSLLDLNAIAPSACNLSISPRSQRDRVRSLPRSAACRRAALLRPRPQRCHSRPDDRRVHRAYLHCRPAAAPPLEGPRKPGASG